MNSYHPSRLSAIYSSSAIRQLEQAALARGHTDLMERAGIKAAELARRIIGNGAAILIVAGPGNNGGDALVAARHLKSWWFRVTLVLAGETAKLPFDAAAALRSWLDAGGAVLDAIPAHGRWDLIIDGLFGIGLARNLSKRYLEPVRHINRLALPVLALDVPSGLDANTGQVFGDAVCATHTLTFIAHKPGLLTAHGPDYCGKLHLEPLGLDPATLLQPSGRLLDETLFSALAPRPRNSHKGLQGSVGVLGGANTMCGAALLAGRAALKSGAGLVYVAPLAEQAPIVDPMQPELMLCSPGQLLAKEHLRCLVLGPGLGQTGMAVGLLKRALEGKTPLVLDADALNLIAATPALQTLLQARNRRDILTPHPAEAGRLLGIGAHDMQQDRIAAATRIAQRYNSLVVVKGVGSVCATPDGRWFVNPSGNPGLSSAGMGDVLSGIIGALIAQHVALKEALLLAVYLHGAAADALVAQGIGPVGMTASDVIEMVRKLLNLGRLAHVQTVV
ncbi:MAG: NAD(P)H-hydrate dehydratase [Sulfuricellaceae bacterium]